MGYYTGDPGFFSTIGNVFKGVKGLLTGTMAGGSAVKQAVSKVSGAIRPITTTIMKHPAISAAGGAAAVAAAGAGIEAAHPLAHLLGRGKHPSARHLRALAMGLRRARPRMNVTNVRALRRALRRTHGFAKLAMRTIHLVHPKKHARFGGFKKRRRK